MYVFDFDFLSHRITSLFAIAPATGIDTGYGRLLAIPSQSQTSEDRIS